MLAASKRKQKLEELATSYKYNPTKKLCVQIYNYISCNYTQFIQNKLFARLQTYDTKNDAITIINNVVTKFPNMFRLWEPQQSKFSTYLYKCILNEINTYLYKQSSKVTALYLEDDSAADAYTTEKEKIKTSSKLYIWVEYCEKSDSWKIYFPFLANETFSTLSDAIQYIRELDGCVPHNISLTKCADLGSSRQQKRFVQSYTSSYAIDDYRSMLRNCIIEIIRSDYIKEQYKQFLLDYFYGGYTYADLAAKYNITLQTVKNWIFHRKKDILNHHKIKEIQKNGCIEGI